MLCSRCPTPLSKRLYDPARQTTFASDYCDHIAAWLDHDPSERHVPMRGGHDSVVDGHGPFQLVARIGVRNIWDYFRSAPSTRVQ